MDPSKRPRRTRPLLKPLILICGIMASLFPGVPFAFFGVLGLTGGLADAGYAFNLRFGLMFLGIVVVVWGLTFVSYLWCVDRLPTRFSMRRYNRKLWTS